MMPTDEPPPQISPRRRRTVRLMLGLISVGVLLHLTVRDAWEWPTSTLFYALPRPLLAIASLLAAGLARRLSQREFGVSLCVAAILWGWVGYRDVRWTSPKVVSSDERPLRIVLWNAAHLARGRAVVAASLQKWDADLIGIVEAGPTGKRDLEDWKRLLPGYEIASPQSQSLILARGKIELHDKVSLGEDSDAMPATVTLHEQTFDIVLVDLLSNVRLSRAAPLRQLVRTLDDAPTRPQIVMGDFNTPPESVGFDPLRRQYRDAFDVAGVGYRPTWPFPVPLLKLDYVWVGSNIIVERCEHLWTTASDHKPVIVSVRIATTPTALPNSRNP